VDALGTLGRVTTFELLTALAFYLFRERGVRYAVIEAGLGGRLDATNVVAPLACAITNVSLDHTEVLGATVAEIAGEKAAIIKPGVPVVSGPQPSEALAVIEEAARRQGAPLTLVGRDVLWEAGPVDLDGQRLTIRTRSAARTVRIPLLGAFQRENAATAIGVCEALVARGGPVGERAMLEGLAQARWPGRLEVLSRPTTGGLVVADGAHNPYSMARLAEALRETFAFRRVVAIVGAGRTKDLGGMLEALARLPVTVVAAQSRNPLALPARQVQDACAARGIPAELAADAAHALERARALAGDGDLVLATGSLFIVAEVRETMLGIPPELYALSRAAV
jgi:dihydrofolate synthase/folylpolyglutamate synthase